MSDQSQPQFNSTEPPSLPPRRRGRSWLLIATLTLAAALTGAAASRAVSQHYRHGPTFMGAAFDPIRAAERADRAIRHLAVEMAWAARQRGRTLLTQPSIDRGAIETLRTEQLALADGASRRLAQALGDAADVLTPEQRRKLDDRLTELRERRGFWQGWHRG